jgi:uncharacterized protein
VSRPFAYVDTSALAKRFINEARSADMDAFLIRGSHQCFLSSLSLTELKSVLKRRLRQNDISQAAAIQSHNQVLLELAQGTWCYHAINESLFTYAGQLVEELTTSLGTLDALHLACAKTARCTLMVSADKQLVRAAAEAGMQTLDLS